MTRVKYAGLRTRLNLIRVRVRVQAIRVRVRVRVREFEFFEFEFEFEFASSSSGNSSSSSSSRVPDAHANSEIDGDRDIIGPDPVKNINTSTRITQLHACPVPTQPPIIVMNNNHADYVSAQGGRGRALSIDSRNLLR